MLTSVEQCRYKWHTTGCYFTIILVPTYLVTIFWNLLDGAFALLFLGSFALVLTQILDIFKEVKLAHILLEIFHSTSLVALILWLCKVIWHLLSNIPHAVKG